MRACVDACPEATLSLAGCPTRTIHNPTLIKSTPFGVDNYRRALTAAVGSTNSFCLLASRGARSFGINERGVEG